MPLMTYEIQDSGEVTNVALKRSSGMSRVDACALAWVKSFRYNKRPGCGIVESQVSVLIHP